MRLELAGSLVVPTPINLGYIVDGTFDPGPYITQGYTAFDVICIGAGGGRGGGVDTNNTGTLVRNYGGEGGGGGIHRVQGLLSELPASVDIVVGAAGADGADSASDPGATTDGSNGGYSSFNGTTCRASGGIGGKRAQFNDYTTSTEADGGDGGIGGTTTAGGGGAGGTAGTPADPGAGTPGTDGEDGTWDGTIGSGGGGGAGGVGKYSTATTLNFATNGGRGAYNPGDLSVYAIAGERSDDGGSGCIDIVPGTGGGAKAAPLTGNSADFGRSGEAGWVVVRLTAG